MYHGFFIPFSTSLFTVFFWKTKQNKNFSTSFLVSSKDTTTPHPFLRLLRRHSTLLTTSYTASSLSPLSPTSPESILPDVRMYPGPPYQHIHLPHLQRGTNTGKRVTSVFVPVVTPYSFTPPKVSLSLDLVHRSSLRFN